MQYEDKIARLESINDQLVAELEYIDTLLHAVGFPEGLKTIKAVAQEVLDENQ